MVPCRRPTQRIGDGVRKVAYLGQSIAVETDRFVHEVKNKCQQFSRYDVYRVEGKYHTSLNEIHSFSIWGKRRCGFNRVFEPVFRYERVDRDFVIFDLEVQLEFSYREPSVHS